MISIPQHLRKLKPYKAGRNVAAGATDTMIYLSSNENNFGPSPEVENVLSKFPSKPYMYPDPGNSVLRKAIADLYKVGVDEVLVRNGSDSILYSLFRNFYQPGDEIVTSMGTFPAVKIAAQSNLLELIEVPLTTGYGYDLHGIWKAVTKRTKAIYLCNPNNPTGTAFNNESLAAFIDNVPDHICIVIDEAYWEDAYESSQGKIDAIKVRKDNTLILRTFSKAYALAGERVGYAIGNPELIDILYRLKPPFVVPARAERAATVALGDQAYLKKNLEKINAIKHDYYKALDAAEVNYIPSFANFVTLNLGSEEKAMDLFNYLKNNGVLTRPLQAFGLPHLVRVSIGTPQQVKQFLSILNAYFSSKKTFATAL